MYRCNCGREFKTEQIYNMHKPYCKGTRYCQNSECNKLLLKKSQKNFCSTSCSAKVMNKGRKHTQETKIKISRSLGGTGEIKVLEEFTCLYCGTTHKIQCLQDRKFCNNKCQSEYKWENEFLPKILSGNASSHLCKKYLLKKYGNVCMICGHGPIWNNKKLVMQLDHINGNSDKNFIINLRLVCPNCHSQTETYGSKGHGNKVKKMTKRNKYLRKYKDYPGRVKAKG